MIMLGIRFKFGISKKLRKYFNLYTLPMWNKKHIPDCYHENYYRGRIFSLTLFKFWINTEITWDKI